MVDHLVDKAMVKNFADLYSLKAQDLARLERMGQKSAQNLCAQIEHSKKKELSKLLFGLGIRHVGVNAARIVASSFGGVDKLLHATKEDFEKIEAVGEVMSDSLVEFFKNKDNIRLIEKLNRLGLNLREPKKETRSRNLAGKTFVLTGTLKNFTRNEAGQCILDRGGRVASSVSKLTEAVIAGEEPGSKLQEAQRFGVKILNEDDFKKLLSS